MMHTIDLLPRDSARLTGPFGGGVQTFHSHEVAVDAFERWANEYRKAEIGLEDDDLEDEEIYLDYTYALIEHSLVEDEDDEADEDWMLDEDCLY